MTGEIISITGNTFRAAIGKPDNRQDVQTFRMSDVCASDKDKVKVGATIQFDMNSKIKVFDR